MKSGLYAWAGASATASAAACAKRFDEPMTKLSKVYFGFVRAGSDSSPLPGIDAPASSPARLDHGCRVPSATVSTTRTSRPSTSRAAARTKPRKCPSIHSRVKSFGTTTENASSRRAPPRPPSPNQVAYVVSLRVSRSRRETSSQRRFGGRLDGVRFKRSRSLLRASRGGRAYQPATPRKGDPDSLAPAPDPACMQGFRRFPHCYPHLWKPAPDLSVRATVAAPVSSGFATASERVSLWITGRLERSSILRLRP